MISVLFSWLIIGLFSYVIGYVSLRALYGKDKEWYSTDCFVIVGLIVIGIYAQIYSLFGGVSKGAFLVLCVFVIICLLMEGNNIILKIKSREKQDTKKIIMGITVLIIASLWTCSSPRHYDTYLYHAQMIRWIEEYGVVPGLGNLHFRFAYNSAIMPLHALFSLKWLFGQSLHTLNGFITLFVMEYCVLSSKKDRLYLTNIIKAGVFVYLLYDAIQISSPNSDTAALLLVFYVVIKWIELSENKRNDVLAYSLLCMIALYCVTVKLSVTPVFLIFVLPLTILLREKRIGDVIKHLLLGVVVVSPFVIRNIIISGYLLYPYELTAIKRIDWILPKEILISDRAEIIAWARKNQDVARNSQHIWQWIGDWYSQINILWQVLLIITAIGTVIIIVDLIKHKFSPELTVIIVINIMGLLFWLFTAPLPRYGTIYMITIPCLALWCLANNCRFLQTIIERGINLAPSIGIALYILLYVICVYGGIVDNPQLALQNDYNNREVYYDNSLGVTVAIPMEGDQVGYDPFPSTAYSGTTSTIELRGETLNEGFRQKFK